VTASEEDVVRAAGGLVLRPAAGGAGTEIALVHRPKYDDWTFPKGKLDPGETDEQAAVREVAEETGLDARLDRELPRVRYRDASGRDKVVRYWTMTPTGGGFRPNREVDELRWLPLGEAATLLTYDHDRALLDELND
jgi:8-oxo-dGTP pyrophosphatase MutT (NUDIX family)